MTEVDSNLAVVGGEPFFRGTRIPVHLVASLLRDGATEEQIKVSYPRLNHQVIRLAPLYAVAYPSTGRPPHPHLPRFRQSTLPAGALPPAKS
jgi:uncharacterized protein (DUF433 family)